MARKWRISMKKISWSWKMPRLSLWMHALTYQSITKEDAVRSAQRKSSMRPWCIAYIPAAHVAGKKKAKWRNDSDCKMKDEMLKTAGNTSSQCFRGHKMRLTRTLVTTNKRRCAARAKLQQLMYGTNQPPTP